MNAVNCFIPVTQPHIIMKNIPQWFDEIEMALSL